jgi:REP element-mobilizing transposase RayT
MSELRVWNGRSLPHWERAGATYFVTFRLFGSIPSDVLARHRQDLDSSLPLIRQTAQLRRSLECYLDQQVTGLLMNRDCAEIVRDVLLRCHCYEMTAWAIMPNHVHVVFALKKDCTLENTVQQWKSVSAHRINKLLGRKGPVWQKEYFDRIVRDEAMLTRVVRYVRQNPLKAGLKGWEFVG